MKRATATTLPISIDIDLDEVQQIIFCFAQATHRLLFTYPSERAIRRENENIIDLLWTKQQTMSFAPGDVKMDAHITLTDSNDNPDTDILTFQMKPTLFTLREVE